MGFNIKIELHEELSKASFCSMVFDEHELIVVPEPMKKIMNLGWGPLRYLKASEQGRRALLKGKAMSLLAEARGVPILQTLAVRVIELCGNVKERVDGNWWEVARLSGSSIQPLSIRSATREVMADTHGFSIPEQLELERYFSGLTDLSSLHHHLLIDHSTVEQRHCYTNYVYDFDLGSYPNLALPLISYYIDDFCTDLLNAEKAKESKERIKSQGAGPTKTTETKGEGYAALAPEREI